MRRLTLSLTALTPTSMGGYDTQVKRKLNGDELVEPPRPTSIRGVWRWWLRAFAAGAAFDEGLDEVEAAMKVAQDLLGTAGIKEERGHQSKFLLRVMEGQGKVIDLSQPDKYSKVPRIRLLSLGKRPRTAFFGSQKLPLTLARSTWKRPCTAFSDQYRFSVEVVTPYKGVDVKSGLSTLLCGLLLGGVGKISRRGFGSLKVAIEGDPLPELQEWKEVLKEGEVFNLNEVKSKLRNAIDLTYNAVKEKVKNMKVMEREEGYEGELPRVPAMAKKGSASKIYLACWEKDVASALEHIGNICTQARPAGAQRNAVKPKPLPSKLMEEKYPTWVLGLPRGQRIRGVKGEGLRRASPIIFKVLSSFKEKTLVVATTLISSDWPKVEKGDLSQKVKATIVKAAIEKVRKHLNQYGFEGVWP